jgi:hypothetical protein
MARQIKVREFERWLSSRDPSFFVGMTRSKFDCPIANYVYCQHRPDDGSVYVLSDYAGWEINGREHIELLPKTLRRFIRIIDDSPLLSIDAKGALSALNQARRRQ